MPTILNLKSSFLFILTRELERVFVTFLTLKLALSLLHILVFWILTKNCSFLILHLWWGGLRELLPTRDTPIFLLLVNLFLSILPSFLFPCSTSQFIPFRILFSIEYLRLLENSFGPKGRLKRHLLCLLERYYTWLF